MKGALRPLALLCVLTLAALFAVGGGSAGNRDGEVTFKAEPGPGAVSYGENIAYSSTFDNTSGSVFTQVRFVQTRPSATLGGTTYTADLAKTSCAAGAWFIDTRGDSDATNDEFVCNFSQQLRPEDDPIRIVVVWSVPANIAATSGCASCLKTKGSWLIKESKATNGNETFPKTGPIEVSAQLLGGQGTDETLRAGGYEIAACTSDKKSLSTNQAVSLDNPVATSFCLPPFAVSGVNVGLATTITEKAKDAHGSEVCIAELGTNCGDGTYVTKDFGPSYVVFEFRVADEALPKGYKITQVFHNSTTTPLPACDADTPVGNNGCVVSIDLDNKTKIWTIVARSETNGPWGW